MGTLVTLCQHKTFSSLNLSEVQAPTTSAPVDKIASTRSVRFVLFSVASVPRGQFHNTRPLLLFSDIISASCRIQSMCFLRQTHKKIRRLLLVSWECVALRYCALQRATGSNPMVYCGTSLWQNIFVDRLSPSQVSYCSCSCCQDCSVYIVYEGFGVGLRGACSIITMLVMLHDPLNLVEAMLQVRVWGPSCDASYYTTGGTYK